MKALYLVLLIVAESLGHTTGVGTELVSCVDKLNLLRRAGKSQASIVLHIEDAMPRTL